MMPFVIWMIFFPLVASIRIHDSKVTTKITDKEAECIVWIWSVIGVVLLLIGVTK